MGDRRHNMCCAFGFVADEMGQDAMAAAVEVVVGGDGGWW